MDGECLTKRLSEGASLEQIGRETGLHASTVAYWAKKYDLTSAGAERFAARARQTERHSRGWWARVRLSKRSPMS